MKMILCCLFFCINIAAANTLNVLNWEGYITAEVIAHFEQHTGLQLNYSTFDNDPALFTKIQLQPGLYDIIAPASYMISELRKAHRLAILDKSKLIYYHDLNPRFTHTPVDPKGHYCLPNYWGTTGIAVNTKYINPKSITSWNDLWQKRFRGKLLIADDGREIFNVALLSLGYSPNDINPKHIHQAYLKLKKLLPNIKIFNEAAEEALLADDDVIIGVGLSGDVFHASEDNPNIQFIYPKEGVAIWLDCLSVSAQAKHPKAAYQFLNYLMQPKLASKLSIAVGYATANAAAVKLLPNALQHNPMLYPSAALLKHAVVENSQPIAIRSLIEHYWERLKLQA